MIGDPAVSVIAAAYLQGIRGYDTAKAFELCRNTVEETKSGRNQRKDYEALGFAPGSISGTLENAYFDYCVARFAKSLGKDDVAERLFKRAQNYHNIYDPSVGNMHAKNANGTWIRWEGATKQGQGCVESNPYQQGWFVPQDVQGMEYSLPEAILKFRQGVGRLIRTKTDKGIIAVLDNRVLTKKYGQAFLDSLPKCPVEIV